MMGCPLFSLHVVILLCTRVRLHVLSAVLQVPRGVGVPCSRPNAGCASCMSWPVTGHLPVTVPYSAMYLIMMQIQQKYQLERVSLAGMPDPRIHDPTISRVHARAADRRGTGISPRPSGTSPWHHRRLFGHFKPQKCFLGTIPHTIYPSHRFAKILLLTGHLCSAPI